MRIVHIVFASYSIFIAANQHLRRAIMDENDGGGPHDANSAELSR